MNEIMWISVAIFQTVRKMNEILVIWSSIARTPSTRLEMALTVLAKICGEMEVEVGTVLQLYPNINA